MDLHWSKYHRRPQIDNNNFLLHKKIITYEVQPGLNSKRKFQNFQMENDSNISESTEYAGTAKRKNSIK